MHNDSLCLQYNLAASWKCKCLTGMQVDWGKFSTLRQQVNRQWHALPKTADVLSQPLKDKVKTVTARLREPRKA